jgi:hypothetical protein
MEKIQETAIQVGYYVIQRIKDAIASFDELINSKESEHEKTIFQVVKDFVLSVHTQEGAKLVDDFFDPSISLEEKARLKEDFEKSSKRIISNNLARTVKL